MIHRRGILYYAQLCDRPNTAGLVRLPKLDRQIILLAVSERSHHRSDPSIGKLSVNFFNRRRVVIAENFGDVCKDKLKRRPFTRRHGINGLHGLARARRRSCTTSPFGGLTMRSICAASASKAFCISS